MKLFVSGKVGEEGATRSIAATLQAAGHELTLDWTQLPHLKPYMDHQIESKRAALQEATAVRDADALVVMADRCGKGMYVELGIALGAGVPVVVVTSDPEITMFFQHPNVALVRTLDEAIESLARLKSTE